MAFGDGGVDDFNPRSRKGSDQAMRRLQDFSHHFNPRSRKGSDEVDLPVELGGGISIHAPARGATPGIRKGLKGTMISIHAPARGATNHGYRFLFRVRFQSTLPQGERLCTRVRCKRPDKISIHAPARGATAQCHPQHKRRKFQSTLPQGERLREGVPVTREGRDFNPRSRKGSDQEYV